ncbi:MAG: transglycosylase domain-containing protein [Burkholderiaceae bacterium]|jgi:monofunctional biosynthetic peptidoglycan transglycosylase|nr:transglycosylase domain-containing protein [Burkholderiaceae bacterium]
MHGFWRGLGRWLSAAIVALALLEAYFIVRIALMARIDPRSTTFQRSEIWRLSMQGQGPLRWQQQWRDYGRISDNLKRAVIASEDDSFVNHDGVDWEAVEQAWERNAKAEEQAEQQAQTRAAQHKPPHALRIRGGSTITQQLAKNLFFSGERTLLRKGQELVLTYALEACLSKRRILALYLNSVEWGEGIFGAEAAAQHYFHKSAATLTAPEAARLAVRLPRPRYFERRPASPYLAHRAAIITARMRSAELP